MAACSDIRYRFYNGIWSNSWSTSVDANIGGGYTGTRQKCIIVAKFKTPAASTTYNHYINKSLTISIPWRPVSTWKNHTIYAKVYTDDPTDETLSTIIPYADRCDGSVYCPHNSYSGVRTTTLTITGLNLNTTYYVVFGGDATSDYPAVSTMSFNYTYSGWNNASVAAPTITNHGNNTFSITASAGVGNTNNTISSSTLKYKRGSDAWIAASSLTAVKNIPITCAADSATQKIQAKVEVVTQRGDNPTGTADDVDVPNYQAPYWNTGAYVNLHNDSLKNGRLTIKKNWKFTWSGATRRNDSSQIVGYKLKLKKGNSYVSGLSYSNGVLTKSGSATEVYTGSTNTEVTFNPLDFSFEPGNTVTLEVSAYAVDGTTSKNKKVSAAKSSISHEVENAGIVRFKRSDGEWVEGQVWYKVSNTDWVEAETVNIKLDDGTWAESQ